MIGESRNRTCGFPASGFPQEVLTLDRDFLQRGAAMGADRCNSVVFGGAGGVVCGLGDGIARERFIEAAETECLPRFQHGSSLFPQIDKIERAAMRSVPRTRAALVSPRNGGRV